MQQTQRPLGLHSKILDRLNFSTKVSNFAPERSTAGSLFPVRAEPGEEMLQALEADRVARYESGAVNYLPVVAEDNNAVLNTTESYEWFTQTHKKMAPNWENQVTFESIEKFIEYNPGVYLPRISPTPLLIMVATRDTLTPTDISLRAFEAANEPKKLAILPGGHFDAYVAGFPHSSGHATAWFKEHLRG